MCCGCCGDGRRRPRPKVPQRRYLSGLHFGRPPSSLDPDIFRLVYYSDNIPIKYNILLSILTVGAPVGRPPSITARLGHGCCYPGPAAAGPGGPGVHLARLLLVARRQRHRQVPIAHTHTYTPYKYYCGLYTFCMTYIYIYIL